VAGGACVQIDAAPGGPSVSCLARFGARFGAVWCAHRAKVRVTVRVSVRVHLTVNVLVTCAAPDGHEVDGLLVADDALATSAVKGAIAVVPLRRATDLLLRLGNDELLRRQVAAVLVLEGEGLGTARYPVNTDADEQCCKHSFKELHVATAIRASHPAEPTTWRVALPSA